MAYSQTLIHNSQFTTHHPTPMPAQNYLGFKASSTKTFLKCTKMNIGCAESDSVVNGEW